MLPLENRTRSACAACASWTAAVALAVACRPMHEAHEPVPEPERPATLAAAGPAAVATVVDAARGRVLYDQQCAVCHGAVGRGDGAAAYLLSPRPRDFGSGRFRLVSTENGAPTDADLVETMRRGMPGSAMPPFEWLPDQDLESLALHVRVLAIEGRTRSLIEKALEDDEPIDEVEAREIAVHQLTPGKPLETGSPVVADADVLARGRALFDQTCASCHGTDGTGRAVKDQWNEDGTPNQPRDFTVGIFKGGSTQDDLVRRILGGLPGSPMPATSAYSIAEARAVAAYAETLIKHGAQDLQQQRRQEITARRTARLPRGPEDEAWSAARPVGLALMPLWWRDQRIETVTVRALHDGREIALRLSWTDPTRDEEILGQEDFTDAVAVQLATRPDAPLFTMGAVGEPVNLWLWKAAWERDLERVRDVADRFPNTPDDMYGFVADADVPLYVTARAAGNRQAVARRGSAAEASSAEGFGTLETLDSALLARGQRTADGWDVVFVRSITAGARGELALDPSRPTSVAFALWDGAQLDRNGQKSVTVWHTLVLER